ncbi:MAG: biopolymer transporter ExbD [Gammaproteobacteria bacterium]|nr:biopolymer transporter ExbD [Gammaproteobacteria bacterium]
MSAARREAGIEITPLIDVVFLLLIFFMVSSSFVQKQVISVTLPESGAAVANVSDTVEISLDAAGMYFVAGQPVGRERGQLLAAMQSIVRNLDARALAEQPVEIRADANATHQSVVRVLDVCAALGLVRVSLATVPVAKAAGRQINGQ